MSLSLHPQGKPCRQTLHNGNTVKFLSLESMFEQDIQLTISIVLGYDGLVVEDVMTDFDLVICDLRFLSSAGV